MTLDQTLSQLHRHLTRLWNPENNLGSSLSYNEYEYLRNVEKLDGEKMPNLAEDDRGGTHLSELAREMQVQKASASVMFNKLEKKGLIQRFPCHYDARAQHIMLTEKGRTLLQQEQKVYQQMAAKIVAVLEQDEAQKLEQLLVKICKRL